MISIVIPTRNRYDDLIECLDSILYSQKLPEHEIIVIDNNSSDSTRFLEEHYPNIKVIRNKTNLGLAAARNIGALESKGKYVLFIDDDNVIAPNMIWLLHDFMELHNDVGILAPAVMYYDNKEVVWHIGTLMNLMTSKPRGFVQYQSYIDCKNKVIDVDNVDNIFIVRKDKGDEVRWFDDKLFLFYTEVDLCQKIAKKGYKIQTFCEAKAWHKTQLPGRKDFSLRTYGFNRTFRAYFLARNRVIIMKRYAKKVNFIIFFLVIYPIFNLFYIFRILCYKKIKICFMYIKGVLDGYYFVITNKIRNSINDQLDKEL